MPNMIHAQVVEDHDIPVIFCKLLWNMPCNIVVDFSIILKKSNTQSW